MKNPFPNVTVVTLPYDSDEGSNALMYVFGHEAPLEGFEAALRQAATDWPSSSEGDEYAEEQLAVGIDWQDVLGQMSTEYLAARGLARLDDQIGTLVIHDYETFPFPDREDEDNEGAA